MRIGFDFDNTIVSYDKLFHKVAVEQGVVPEETPVNKIAVRDYLRSVDKEAIWTEMQGYVYGARMREANAFPNVLEVMRRLKKAGHTLAIMSHKTKHPFLGTQYDLHAAARDWIYQSLLEEGELIIPDENIFFELTQKEKLERIAKFGCDIFIDDLPEIFINEIFPIKAQKFLFDPEENHASTHLPNIKKVQTWQHFENELLFISQIQKLLSTAGLSTELKSINPCTKSGNNRTYKVETCGGTFAVKQYFQQAADKRDRLATEFAFLTYAKLAAQDMVPFVYCQDAESNLALYEFIDGQPLKEITESEVQQAIDFFCALNKPAIKQEASALANASEACFSIQSHLDLVDARIQALQQNITEDERAQQLIKKLAAHWQLLLKNIKEIAASKKIDLLDELDQSQRCISPSDFGFHNALKKPDGKICFLDFEYAGWDDPAKMVGDFFSQLAIPVPEKYFDHFTQQVMKPFPNSEKLIQRANLLRGVYQIKWCCIALNIFIPMHLARRKFANPDLNIIDLKKAQLSKAESLMENL